MNTDQSMLGTTPDETLTEHSQMMKSRKVQDVSHVQEASQKKKEEEQKKPKRKLSVLKNNLKKGGENLGGLMSLVGVDVFDKSIMMAGAEIALMSVSQKIILQKSLWKKQRRYDILQLVSAMAGTIIGCTEAWLFYVQTAIQNDKGEIDYNGEGEATHLTIIRSICSILAFTAGRVSHSTPRDKRKRKTVEMSMSC